MILDTDRISSDGEYRDELRHRCETDHFFLADIMGFDEFDLDWRDPVTRLYFPKNRNLSIPEQHPKKFRMHLDPRGTGKTTFGLVDTTQWVLAFADVISIMNETATQELAKSITNAVGMRFYQRKGADPTNLQLIYPELCHDKFYSGSYISPTRTKFIIEPTLGYTSPQTSQSGWHPWVINPDDMVDSVNSGVQASDASRKSIIDVYHANKNTLRFGGYLNVRGTRYHPFDLYGDLLENMDSEEWEVLIRSSMRRLDNRRLSYGEFPNEDEVEIFFPRLLSYRKLKELFGKSLESFTSFMCQQQNDAFGGNVPVFSEDLFKTMQIPAERIPAIGDMFICWRLPYTGKDYMAKYAEGAAALVYEGKVYIVDAWQGTYTPSRLAEKIVRECRKHQTGTVMMEDLPGIQYIEAHIRNEAMRRNMSMKIQWLDFQEDDTQRIERMRNLEPQAEAGRVLISTGAGKAAELRRQFLNFGLVVENGIVDCVSRLAAKVPASLMRAEIDDEEKELQIQRRNDVMSQFVYGQQGGVDELETRRAQENAAQAAAMASIDNLGLTDILGGLDG
jgi:hypothetical protein